jgi:hypothetical protein
MLFQTFSGKNFFPLYVHLKLICMSKFILLFAFAACFIVSCDKNEDPDPVYPYSGTYNGNYTLMTTNVTPSPIPGTAVVADATANSVTVVLTVNGTVANLNANIKADNSLEFPQQSMFGMTVTGTGTIAKNGTELGLVFASSSQVTVSGATFRGLK